MAPKKKVVSDVVVSEKVVPEKVVVDVEDTIESVSKSLSHMMINSSKRLVEAVCEEYDLDVDKVNEISNRVLAEFIGEVDATFMKPMKPSKVVKMELEQGEMCKFVLLRGDRKGEVCGKRATKGFSFCSIHKAAMIKKGELIDKPVDKGKQKEIQFTPYNDDTGTYIVCGTKLLATRSDIAKDISVDNCEIVGYLDDGKMVALDDVNRKVADANKLRIG